MRNLLTCRIGREWYGIQIDDVLAVLHLIALRDVPGDDIVGIMTLREQAIPVVDARALFELAAIEYDMDTPIVAVQLNQQRLGLIVDEVDTVLSVSDEKISPYRGQWLNTVVQGEQQIIFLLDLPVIVNRFC